MTPMGSSEMRKGEGRATQELTPIPFTCLISWLALAESRLGRIRLRSQRAE